jgi:hypothetical protein
LLEEPEFEVTVLLSGDCGFGVIAGGALAAVKDAVSCCVIMVPELTTEFAEIVRLEVELLSAEALFTSAGEADLA